MDELKCALLHSPALHPIDHDSEAPVILTIDISKITVSYQLCQQDSDDPQRRYYARFASGETKIT